MRNNHKLVRCKKCAKTFTSMLEMDDHYHDTHKDHIPIDWKICGTLVPDTWNLMEHMKWHDRETRKCRETTSPRSAAIVAASILKGRTSNTTKHIA